jgi:hypothetical protein
MSRNAARPPTSDKSLVMQLLKKKLPRVKLTHEMSNTSCFLLGVVSGALTVGMVKLIYDRVSREDAERLLDHAQRQLQQLEERLAANTHPLPA